MQLWTTSLDLRFCYWLLSAVETIFLDNCVVLCQFSCYILSPIFGFILLVKSDFDRTIFYYALCNHRLNFEEENSVSLSANHLQKLRVSFQLSTPLGNAFNPHQVFNFFFACWMTQVSFPIKWMHFFIKLYYDISSVVGIP